MYLKSMTLFGFKSFATKINLTFSKGVVAIVGPNGCGKSNIADAIKWALGENSAKPLRGTSMQDVIFSGTKNKRGLGLAEVSLVFDNMDRLLPLDFEEVTISRKLFRSGESEYYLNGILCRLKDIIDVFSGTGLGKEAYSVIEQGKVDALLSAKPEDRRAVFDEASGIMRYKARKRESERKLQEVYTNKTRVEDLVVELERQLPEISTQAEVATEYMDISEEISKREILVNSTDARKLHDKFTEISTKILALTEKEEEVSTKIVEKEAFQESSRLELLVSETELENVHAKLSDTKATIEREEGNINLLKERLQSLLQNQNRIENERIDIEKEQSDAKLQYEALKAECSLSAISLQDRTRDMKEIEDRFNSFEAQSAKLSSSIETYKSDIFDISSKMAELNNRRITLTSQIDGSSFRLNRIKTSHSEKLSELEDTISKNEELKTSLANLEKEIMAKQEGLKNCSADEERVKSELNEINRELESNTRSKSQLNATYQALVNLESNYEGYNKAIKYVFGEYKGKDKGLFGTVSELVKVPSGFEIALEAAFGASIQNVISVDASSAESAVNALKTSKAGRATFLPLDILTSSKLSASEIPTKEPGYLGLASDIVETDKTYAKAIDYLLGRCVVSNTLKDAIAMRKKGFRCKFVTIDGEILAAGGAITGGQGYDHGSSGLLTRKNKISEIETKVAELDEKISESQMRSDEYIEQLNQICALKETYAQGASEYLLEQKSLAERESGIQRDISRMQEEKDGISLEIESLEKEKTDNAKEIESIAKTLNEFEADKKKIEASYDQSQKELSTFFDEGSKHKEMLTDSRILLAEKKAAHAALVRDLSRVNDSLELFENKIKKCDEDVNRIESSTEDLNKETSKLRLNLDKLIGDHEDIEGELNDQRIKKQHISENISKSESEIKSLRRSYNITLDQIKKHEIEKVRISSELDHIATKLQEYDVDIESIISTKETTEIDKKAFLAEIAEFSQRLESLGPINHTAVEEYKTLKERYDFLQYQLSDLDEASASLKEVIKEIERTCKKQFMEIYGRIRIEFREIYAKLFNGGEADLVLTDENDPLEGGVEIMCQPPGKKLASLSLLSGGERALTAIALIFAIMTVKPSSFCVLDEIDSALDEANVERFRDLVIEFSERTQILLVTHRKGTMESADYIYGVTMEESGVSKILSVSTN